MKKILTLSILTLLLGCSPDSIEDFEPIAELPEQLQIAEAVGLKLENSFVTNKVSINAKFDIAGTYRIKIIDISGRVVSQDKIQAKEGDNILNIYSTLNNLYFEFEKIKNDMIKLLIK